MPFGVFWMRAHFVNMPDELTEAARIDGATTWQLFWGVHVPLARPALVVARDPDDGLDVEPVPARDRARQQPARADDGRSARRLPGRLGHERPAPLGRLAADPRADDHHLLHLPAPVRLRAAPGLAEGLARCRARLRPSLDAGRTHEPAPTGQVGLGLLARPRRATSTTSSTCRRRGRSSSPRFATTTPRSATPSRATCAPGASFPTRFSPGRREAGTTSRPGPGARSSTTGAGTCSTRESTGARKGLIQRIGLAVSDDLVTWVKHPGNPVLEADPRWYDLLDRHAGATSPGAIPGCSGTPTTARSTASSPPGRRSGASDGAGVVGHARSRDLVDWEVLPPVTRAGRLRAGRGAAARRRRRPVRAARLRARPKTTRSERIERLGAPGETGTFVFAAERDVRAVRASPTGPIAAPGRAARHALCRQARRARAGSMGVHGVSRRRRPRLPRRADRPAAGHGRSRRTAARRVRRSSEPERIGDARARDPVAARLGRDPRRDAQARCHCPSAASRSATSSTASCVAAASSSSRSAATDRRAIRGRGRRDPRPRSSRPTAPGRTRCFVHFHGGGFVFGTIDSLVNDAKCAHICRAAECVVVDRRVPARAGASFPDRGGRLLRGASAGRSTNAGRLGIDACACRRRRRVRRRATSPRPSRSWPATAAGRSSRSSCSKSPSPTSVRGADDHPSVALFGEGYGLDRGRHGVLRRSSTSQIRTTARARTRRRCSRRPRRASRRHT